MAAVIETAAVVAVAQNGTRSLRDSACRTRVQLAVSFVDRHLIMRASRLSIIVGAAAIIAGCNPFSGPCTTDIRWGIVVEVRNAVTGESLADGARLIVRDGDYVETVDGPPVPGFPELRAAGERAGTYDVTIQKAGYQDWTRTGIRVRDQGCHVETVRLDARLQPTS